MPRIGPGCRDGGKRIEPASGCVRISLLGPVEAAALVGYEVGHLPLVRHLTVPAGAVRRVVSESPDGRLVRAALELVESVGLGDQECAVPQPARRLTARHS